MFNAGAGCPACPACPSCLPELLSGLERPCHVEFRAFFTVKLLKLFSASSHSCKLGDMLPQLVLLYSCSCSCCYCSLAGCCPQRAFCSMPRNWRQCLHNLTSSRHFFRVRNCSCPLLPSPALQHLSATFLFVSCPALARQIMRLWPTELKPAKGKHQPSETDFGFKCAACTAALQHNSLAVLILLLAACNNRNHNSNHNSNELSTQLTRFVGHCM